MDNEVLQAQFALGALIPYVSYCHFL